MERAYEALDQLMDSLDDSQTHEYKTLYRVQGLVHYSCTRPRLDRLDRIIALCKSIEDTVPQVTPIYNRIKQVYWS